MMYIVTAGHSNSDPGAIANGIKEADVVTDLRKIVALKLRNRGHKVITDGDDAVNKSLKDSIQLLKLHPGAVAIELHCNASENPKAGGVETIALPKDKRLAQRISSRIADTLGTKVRGDGGWIDQSQSHRGKLGYVEAGGLVVEVFFLSNPEELKTYNEVKWLVAEAIVEAIQ